jgi:DNA-binding response OmpR family regulator
MKLLLVEDDSRIAAALAEALTDQRYSVDLAADGEEGWNYIETYPYDLVVLDVMLPRLNGMALCQRLRQKGYAMPVLILTAKDTSSDKVMGLDVGADDYVVKPFDLKELLARVRALLRRSSSIMPPVLEWGELRLDSAAHTVTHGAQILSLTPKEYGLLELFVRNPSRVFSRSAILNHLWAVEEAPGEETIKVHLRALRQKLKGAGAADDFIETVYGLGYRLKQAL